VSDVSFAEAGPPVAQISLDPRTIAVALEQGPRVVGLACEGLRAAQPVERLGVALVEPGEGALDDEQVTLQDRDVGAAPELVARPAQARRARLA
jgi:hypothetical protein